MEAQKDNRNVAAAQQHDAFFSFSES